MREGIDYAVVLTADHGGHGHSRAPARQQGVARRRRADPALATADGRQDRSPRRLEARAGPVLLARRFGDMTSGSIARSSRGDRARAERGSRRHLLARTRRSRRCSPARQIASDSGRRPLAGQMELDRAGPRIVRSRALGRLLCRSQAYVTPIAEPSVGYVATHGSPGTMTGACRSCSGARACRRPTATSNSRPSNILPTLAAMIGLAVPAGSIDGKMPEWGSGSYLPGSLGHSIVRLFRSLHLPFRNERQLASLRRGAVLAGGVGMRKFGIGACARGQRCRSRVRPDAAICRRPIRAAAGRLQAAGDAARRERRIAHDRRHGRAARRLDRAGRAATSSPRSAPQQAARGGKVLIHATARTSFPASAPKRSPISSGCITRSAIRSPCTNIRAHHLPTKRGKGLDWTLGEDAVALGRRTGYDYALFLYAEDSFASTGRIGAPGARRCRLLHRLLRSQVGGGGQFAYASLVDLRTGEVVWFNVVQAGSQIAGHQDRRHPHARGRGADGRAAARPDEAGPRGPPGGGEALMCMRCAELSRRTLLAGGGALAASLATGVAQARVLPAGHGPADRPGLPPDRRGRKGPVAADGPGRGGGLRLQPADQGSRARLPICRRSDRPRRRSRGEGHAHLSGADSRIQRDDVPDRLFGRLLRPAAADAQRGAAGRRDRP